MFVILRSYTNEREGFWKKKQGRCINIHEILKYLETTWIIPNSWPLKTSNRYSGTGFSTQQKKCSRGNNRIHDRKRYSYLSNKRVE